MMKRILTIGAVILAVAIAGVAYAVFKPPESASGPIEAIPVVVGTEEPAAATPTPADPPAEAEPSVEPTAATKEAGGSTEPTKPTSAANVPVEPTSTVEPTAVAKEGEGSAEPTKAAEEASAPDPTPTAEPTLAIFEIVQAESETRFLIDEVLRGSPKTVVGVTDQVAGEIAIDVSDPPSAQVGTILVNARTLVTDNEFRNRAVKNRILQTDTYEFVTFVPTEILGLPDSAAVGQGFAFQIVGDLTVRDVTREVVFEAVVTPLSETRLEGTASTTILYADFDLAIPDSPSVDTVEDEVILELDFVAVAQ